MINRKAITPVIAVVLLLMMTVAAAGAAFFWMTTIQSRIQGQIGTQVSETTLTSTTSLNVINVICNTSPGAINVTLQNTGSNTISSGTTAMTLTDTQDKVLKTVTSSLLSSLSQNEIITMNYSLEGSIMTVDDTYGIKITMPGGAEQTSDCIAQ
jgi:flagellin-like protein